MEGKMETARKTTPNQLIGVQRWDVIIKSMSSHTARMPVKMTPPVGSKITLMLTRLIGKNIPHNAKLLIELGEILSQINLFL